MFSGTVEIYQSGGYARGRTVALLVVVAAIALGCVQQANVPGYSSRAIDPYMAKRWSSPGFTTAHASFGAAAKHFLSIKPKPQQPIDFPHKIHTVNEIGIECQECHTGVQRGAQAGIPSINFCMTCHEDIGNKADAGIRSLRDVWSRPEASPRIR